jgi:hypothetical protein
MPTRRSYRGVVATTADNLRVCYVSLIESTRNLGHAVEDTQPRAIASTPPNRLGNDDEFPDVVALDELDPRAS